MKKLILLPLLILVLSGCGIEKTKSGKDICIEKGGIPIEKYGGGYLEECQFPKE